jgi:hypothetical protein
MQKNGKEQSNATRCRYQFNPGNKSSENCHSNWFSSSLEHSRSKLHAVRKVVEQRKEETPKNIFFFHLLSTSFVRSSSTSFYIQMKKLDSKAGFNHGRYRPPAGR